MGLSELLILLVSVILVNAQDGCKSPAILTASSGTFSSPYYHLYPTLVYPTGLSCRWSVKVEAKKNIRITIKSPMSINGMNDYCGGDSLAVLPGGRPNSIKVCDYDEDEMLAGPFCAPAENPVPPGSFVVGSDNIDVEFCSIEFAGGEPNFHGFELTYEATENAPTPVPTVPPPPPFECDGVITVTPGTAQHFESPLYPAPYPRNVDCVWKVTGPENYPLIFVAETFAVEFSPVCRFDQLTLIDDTKPSNEGNFCGPDRFPNWQSTGNKVTATFHSDPMFVAAGFKIRIEVGPCPIGTSQCPNSNGGSGAPVCFHPNQLCDGKRDCPDGGDEICPAGCGIQNIKPLLSAGKTETRVGGYEARPHSWPWQVQIFDTPDRQSCGGSIIDRQWIVTSAGCCRGIYGTAEPFLFHVRVGEHDTTVASEKHAWTYDLENVFDIPHNNEDDSATSDICLMKTKTPILFSEHVQPICLAFGQAHVSGETCYATGWGSSVARDGDVDVPIESRRNVTETVWNPITVSRERSPKLRQVDLKIMNHDSCQIAHESDPVTKDVVCASSPGKDRCEADEGGPLMCKSHADGSRWELIGVALRDRHCGETSKPGLFTNVWHYIDWIAETIMTN